MQGSPQITLVAEVGLGPDLSKTCVKPHLSPSSSRMEQDGCSAPCVLHMGVLFLSFRNATQGRGDTGLASQKPFFYDSDSSKVKAFRRVVPDDHTNLSLNEELVIQLSPVSSMQRERNNGLEHLCLS